MTKQIHHSSMSKRSGNPIMKQPFNLFAGVLLVVYVAALATEGTASAEEPKFRAVAFYNTKVEKSHVQFATDALEFYAKLAADKNFVFDSTTDWNNLNADYLSRYQVVLWLNDSAHSKEQRAAFEQYMEHGGAWLGFHVSGYNDKTTQWPWFVQFLGGAVFYSNNWPVGPEKVKLSVDTNDHPVTRRLPKSYDAPPNEFYQWIPSPRLSSDVQVLVTLDPSNFPLGKKVVLTGGDVPVVWTNTKYKMVYTVLGHGDESGVFSSPIQNRMFEDALLWLHEKK
jgi:uncharacterized protein